MLGFLDLSRITSKRRVIANVATHCAALILSISPFQGVWGGGAPQCSVLYRAHYPIFESSGKFPWKSSGVVWEVLKVMQCTQPVPMFINGTNPDTGKLCLTAKIPKFRLSSDPDLFVPCGRCLACLMRRRSEWVRRLQSELFVNPNSSFVTLTYNNENLPLDGKCSKSDIQKFLKRFRQSARDYGVSLPDNFKYFIVCEYGEKYKRPHYHGIFFGVDFKDDKWKYHFVMPKDGYPLYSSSVLESIWSKGFVTVDEVTSHSIQYVAKYITKSCTGSVYDTWALYSRRIGVDYFYNYEDNLFTRPGENALVLGKMAFPTGNNDFYWSAPPKSLDRYVERFDFDWLSEIKLRRKNFVISKRPDLRLPSVRNEGLLLRLQTEQSKRKLDNES